MPSTIALVDDDKNILTSVAMALEAEGFKVRTYADGRRGICRGLVASPVDLAVLISRCRGWMGWSFKESPHQTAMPVIFLTSKDDEIDELLGLRMGLTTILKAVLAATAHRAHSCLVAPPRSRQPGCRQAVGGHYFPR